MGHARPMTDPGIEYVVRRPVVEGPIEVRFPLRAGRSGARRGRRRPRARVADRRPAARRAARRGSRRARRGRGPSGRSLDASRRTRRGSSSAAAAANRPASSCSSSAGTGGWPPASIPSRSTPRSPASSTRSGPESGSASGRRGASSAASRRSASRREGVLAINPEPGEGSKSGARLRPGSLDVGLAGAILVVGSRVDAETLTRARAMGLRGIIVAGLAGKDRRDFLASEARQRASLHRLPTFAVLVLDGAVRRQIAGPDRRRPRSAGRPRGRDRHWIRRRWCSTSRTIDLPPPPPRPRPGPGRRAGRPGGPLGGSRRPAPLRRRNVPRGRLGRVRRLAAGAGPAGRPRAVRLRLRPRQAPGPWATLGPMSVPTALERRFISARPGDDARAGRQAGGRCPARRSHLPAGRARSRQDAVREGIRGGPRA